MTSFFFLVSPILPHGFWLLRVWFWCIYGQVSEFVLLGFHGASQICRLFFIISGSFQPLPLQEFCPFSVSFPSGTPVTCISAYVTLSYRSVFDFVSPFCSLDCIFQFFVFAYSFFCLKHHSVILFSSLDMVFFNSLSILIIAGLKSLSTTKIQSLGFLRHSFSLFLFSCVYAILCFFTCLMFLLNTRCFEYYNVELWKYQICCWCLL